MVLDVIVGILFLGDEIFEVIFVCVFWIVFVKMKYKVKF